MTHTLYRAGSPESQSEEVCWLLYTTKGVNDANFPETAKHVLQAMEESGGYANWGDTKIGTIITMSREEIEEKLAQNSRIRGVFSNPRSVVSFLKGLKEKELNQSVLIAGVLSDLADICKKAGVTPRYANMSLGVFGNKAKLADGRTLSITTMCGHHRISPKYVHALQQDVDTGKITAIEAAEKIARLCLCGVFNPDRAAGIFGGKTAGCQCEKKPSSAA